MAIPATLGSVVGVLAAEKIPGRGMALVITAAVMAAFLLLVTRMRSVIERPQVDLARITTAGMFALLGVGFWLGFIVLDGATYLLLVLILMFHFDLVHANALKALLAVADCDVRGRRKYPLAGGPGDVGRQHRRRISRCPADHA
jgi:uncharacterized membrane protein YfcA